MAGASCPFARVEDGVTVAVRVTPKAKRTAVIGLAPAAGGHAALKASVTAAPERGRANAALIALLAGEWDVAKSRITVARGAAGRSKLVHVAGDPEELMARLGEWAEGLHG